MVKQCDDKKIATWRGSEVPLMIGNEELVVGDIFRFDNGMKLPCDGVMVDGKDVFCQEMDLTGEPDSFPKVVLNEDSA